MFVVANAFWTYILDKLGFAAIVMPWRTVYVRKEWWTHDELIRHEMIHLEQIDRHGPVCFSALYLWYAWKYGYRRNPFEREAYRRAAP